LAQRLPPEVRRERILDTAMEMLAEKGYRGLTMKAVAVRCGLTAPAITYYFKDMQTLLIAVLRRRDALDAYRFLPTGPDGTLTAADIAAGVYHSMMEDPHAARLRTVMSIEAMDPSHPAHDACRERDEVVVAFLVSHLRDRYDDADRLARTLIAALEGVQSAWLRHPDYIDLEMSLQDIVTWVITEHVASCEALAAERART
jgi:AcrR family transcriptional regulator